MGIYCGPAPRRCKKCGRWLRCEIIGVFEIWHPCEC